MGHTHIEIQAMDATIQTARHLARIADALEKIAEQVGRPTFTVDITEAFTKPEEDDQ